MSDIEPVSQPLKCKLSHPLPCSILVKFGDIIVGRDDKQRPQVEVVSIELLMEGSPVYKYPGVGLICAREMLDIELPKELIAKMRSVQERLEGVK